MSEQLPSFLTPRSQFVTFDPQFVSDLRDVPQKDLSIYLIALAAAQRGLKVTFWGSSVQARSTAWGRGRESNTPRLVTIENGSKRHFFDRTQGDRSSQKTVNLCINKEATKEVLRKAGILVPKGLQFTGKNHKAMSTFLEKSEAKKYLIKPVEGSLAKGVHREITAQQALKIASSRQNRAGGFMLEEQIFGNEYRVYVVGGKVASAYQRVEGVLLGDGRNTVAQLIFKINESRKRHPYLNHRLIDLSKVALFLAKSGQTLNYVPVFGQKVVLSGSFHYDEGGTSKEVSQTISDNVARAAIGACQALDLPNGGIDLIERDDQVFILEANTRAYIASHSFPEIEPGCGNAIAEAIIDFYFPSPKPIQRDQNVWIDVKAIREAFDLTGEETRHEVTAVRREQTASQV